MEDQAIQKYSEQGATTLKHARSIKIVDNDTRVVAAEFATKARKFIKAIKVELDPDIKKANDLHKSLTTKRKSLIAPFKDAQEVVDKEIRRDFMVQEKLRREEERVAQEKADAAVAAEEVEVVDEVGDLIDAGDLEGAEALLNSDVVAPPVVPVAPVQRSVASSSGTMTMRKDIKVELSSTAAVMAAILEKRLPGTFVEVNMAVAKRYAKVNGFTETTDDMPGFTITATAVASGRTL